MLIIHCARLQSIQSRRGKSLNGRHAARRRPSAFLPVVCCSCGYRLDGYYIRARACSSNGNAIIGFFQLFLFFLSVRERGAGIIA